MKKIIIALALIGCILPANAYQLQESQIKAQSSKQKIYSSTGSLVEYREVQRNGQVKVYNRYHQAIGTYKKVGGKIIYKSKR